MSSPATGALTGALILLLAIFSPLPAFAHVSEQGFILLLPTTLYIISGVAAVTITTAVMAALPAQKSAKLFNPLTFLLASKFVAKFFQSQNITSLASTAVLIALVLIGYFGPHDPLENLLPLVVWTVWWQGFLILQAIFGNLWHWINPWSGIYALIRGDLEKPGFWRLPLSMGCLPAILTFIAFAIFSLVDIAPDNPSRLATIVVTYWLFTLFAMIIFGGKDWLARGECFTLLLKYFAMLSPFTLTKRNFSIGLPGWRLVNAPEVSLSIGVFAIIILAIGSFDGLNETFFWLEKIDINPLEFPGRSQVILPNMLGLLAAISFLPAFFAALIYLGVKFSGLQSIFTRAFAILSLTAFPIAAGYHFSHFLTAFMVNIQYTLAALSDPFDAGADYLNLGTFYVTGGFLNSHHTVKLIWLLQAVFVVGGHMIAVLLTHCLALRAFKNSAKILAAQLPLALFMIAYTLFGLWLLASPRGV